MSERWKPEHGDTFWYVSEYAEVDGTTWVDDEIDPVFYESGNCFRTAEEAEAAAEKVKALLLSLHDNNLATNLQDKQDKLQDKPLPKLTAEVFDREGCPEWAKYAAVDRCGVACFFDEKPKCDNIEMWLRGEYGESFTAIRNTRFDTSDWQNSLIERPAKLPDWCKAGEWFYDHHQHGYDKIIAIEDGSRYCVKTEKKCHFTIDCVNENIVPARLRPYNAEEMRGLVGKVIEDKIGNRCLMTVFTVVDNKIVAFNKYCSADDLLKSGYTIDGKTCGVLEHLENGEWVK